MNLAAKCYCGKYMSQCAGCVPNFELNPPNMPQKYTLEYLKQNKVAVNCRTLEEIEKVCKITGAKWLTKPIEMFSIEGEYLTIEFDDEVGWVFSNIQYVIGLNYKVIIATEFLQDWEESKPTDNATTIAAIRTHLTAIDNLLKTIE